MVDGTPEPVRVAVVTGLADQAPVGGHAGVWLRVAEAAAAGAGAGLQLDLLFLRRARAPAEEARAPHVCIHRVPPLLDSDRLPFARTAAGGTELFSPSPALWRRLEALAPDVVVISDPFGFGRTAARWAKRRGRALVYAVQTRHDVFAAIYSRAILARLLGERAARVLDARLQLPARLAARTGTRIAHLMATADHILASSRTELARLCEIHPPARVSLWRRGVDFARFSPARRDRAWLETAHGVPRDRFLLLFAGRVDESKGAPLLLEAVGAAMRVVPRLHLFIAGEGPWRARAKAALGARVTAPGALTQDELARVMASADAFVFPSPSEAAANVLREAQAAGLPILVPASEAVAELVEQPGRDGFALPAGAPAAWAGAIAALARQDAEARVRERVGIAARARRRHPDWRTVLDEDLLPVWRRLARCRRG